MKKVSAQAYADPDRRYWRRRANREIRRSRRVRATVRWAAIVAIHLTLVGAIVVAGLRVLDHVRVSPEFALEHIQIFGIERAPGETILRDLERYRGRNVLDLDLEEVSATVETHRWVQRASVRRVLPRSLRITVTECRPAAIGVGESVSWVVDEDGSPVTEVSSVHAFDLPLLTGLGPQGEPAFQTALRRGVAALRRLESTQPEWADGVVELDLSRPDRIVVTTVGSEPKLVLDPMRVERNLDQYLALRDEISRRLGETDYVDLRWRDRISLMPRTRS